jgi:hypothetical protein
MIGEVVASAALALVPSTGAARPPVALVATPSHLVLQGNARAAVRVTNSGARPVVVDVSRAGFALNQRGRPLIARTGGARSAARWLTFRPAHFAVAPHAGVLLVVASKLPRHAEPGDHDALVLLLTRPLVKARVAVRLRMGVVVVVRAPGKVVRRLELRRLRVARRGHERALELVVANRGNVTESLGRTRAVVSFARSGRRVAALVARSRDVRPRTSGIVEFPLRRLPHGWMRARIMIPAQSGRRVLQRTFRIRL